MIFEKKMTQVIVTTTTLGLLLAVGACTGQTEEEKARNQVQSQKAQGETLEKANLELKRQREEDPNAVRYVYLTTFGQPMGYYVSKGKISSSGSQRTPEQDNMWTCRASGTTDCAAIVVDGAKDDGSYGDGDPGIFFFLADGTMVETNWEFAITDHPIPVPGFTLLGGTP